MLTRRSETGKEKKKGRKMMGGKKRKERGSYERRKGGRTREKYNGRRREKHKIELSDAGDGGRRQATTKQNREW